MRISQCGSVKHKVVKSSKVVWTRRMKKMSILHTKESKEFKDNRRKETETRGEGVKDGGSQKQKARKRKIKERNAYPIPSENAKKNKINKLKCT